MTKELGIDLEGTDSIEESTAKIDAVFEKVGAALSDGRKFLVGNSFTAADLTFSALSYFVAAAAFPEMWKVRWPGLDHFSESYQQQVAQWVLHPAGQHCIRMYAEHRFHSGAKDKTIRILHVDTP